MLPPHIQEFGESLTHAGRSPATVKSYLLDMKAFVNWYCKTNTQDFHPANISFQHLQDYMQYLDTDLKLKPTSLNRKLASIKSFLAWAGTTGIISHKVLAPKSVRTEKLRPQWLTLEEQNEFLAFVESCANSRDIAIVRLLLNSGLRVQELCSLKWNDVKIEEEDGSLTVNHSNRNKCREVPLNKAARSALHLAGFASYAASDVYIFQGQRGPLTSRGVQFMLKRYTEAGNFKSISPQNLRHSFCKNLLNAGVSLKNIAKIAGHENLETTRRYCEPAVQNLKESVELIEAE